MTETPSRTPRTFRATHPGTGEESDTYAVHLTDSGMHIVLTDVDAGGHVLWIHRFAWETMKTAVDAMFAQEQREAEEQNRFDRLMEGDD